MASRFVQVDIDFADSEACGLFAAELGLDPDVAAAKMIRAWAWALNQALRAHGDHPIRRGLVQGRHAGRLIALAARWSGSPEEFTAAAIVAGLIDPITDGGLRFRGWEDRYRAGLKKQWRDLVRKREDRSDDDLEGDCATTSVYSSRGDCRGDNPAPKSRQNGAETAPKTGSDPDPDPYKEEEKKPLSETAGAVPTDASSPALKVFEHWKARMRKGGKAKFKGKRRRAVEARLRDGYTVEELCEAVDGCAVTPHNLGLNESGQRYDDLELICRNEAQVERFQQNARAPPKPATKATNGRATEADKDWSRTTYPTTPDGQIDLEKYLEPK